MNNTRNLLLITIITATLVIGTTVIPMQSYADRGDSYNKKDKDIKSKVSASYESDKKSSSQKMDQDNFCYRSDDCEQANQGQQLAGKDNEAKGFNDQSDNVKISIPGTGNGNGNGNGNNPDVTACIDCFLDNLNNGQEMQLERELADGIEFKGETYTSIEQICKALDAKTLTTEDARSILALGLPGEANPPAIRAIIACLNLIFTTTT